MKIIAYYRVSTKKQGKRRLNAEEGDDVGLGLLAQKQAVENYAKANDGTILAEYTEVESGKCKDRPILAQALAHAKLIGATLVISKLDRLARNVYFLSSLMEAGVNFVCCDNAQANRLTLHILAAVAEAEAEFISKRTKEGLAQTRRLGTKLGGENPKCRNLTRQSQQRGRAMGTATVVRQAEEFREAILPLLQELAATMSHEEVAAAMNARGFTTRRNRPFTPETVQSILFKAKGEVTDGAKAN